MALPRNAYTLRFGSAAEATITKEEAMTLARSRGMSLRAFMLAALADERERLLGMPLGRRRPARL